MPTARAAIWTPTSGMCTSPTYAHTPPGGHADGSCGDMDSYLWHVYVTE